MNSSMAVHGVATRMSGTLRIQNVALIYLCMWTIAPPLAYGEEYRYVAVFAGLAWVAMELARKNNIFLHPTVPVLLCAAYILYTAAIEWTLGAEAQFDWHIQPTIMFFFLLVYESRRRNLDTLAPVFWWTLVSLPMWLILSLFALNEYGHAARVIVRASDEAMELAERGVGGYGLVYFTLALLPVLIVLTLSKREQYLHTMPRVLRRLQSPVPVLTAVTALLAALFIVKAQYSIALYLAVLLLPAIFLPRRYALAVATIALPVAILSVQPPVLVTALNAAGSVFQDTNVGNKINDVLTSIQEDSAYGSVGDRVERYSRSTDLFLHSPLLGVLELRDVGKHSSYLDRFARYGLLFGALFVYLIVYVPLRMMKEMKTSFGMAFAVFLVAALFPLLNNVFIGFGTALYIMFPVVCSILGPKGVTRARPARTQAAPALGDERLPVLPNRRDS